MYLHELGRIIRKTGKNQTAEGSKGDAERAQLFFPAVPVITEYRFNVVFINRWIDLTDRADVFSLFIVIADPLLIGKRDLRIGDHGR